MSAAIKSTEPENQISNEKPLPNSRRIYIDGTQPGVRVPFREIDQNQTRNFDGTLEENPPVRVYDTSGPWGDPVGAVRCARGSAGATPSLDSRARRCGGV